MWHSTSVVVQPSIAARALSLIRPSRIAALAIIVAVPMLISNCRQVISSVMSAPSYIGPYERQAGLAYGALPRQTLDVYVPRGAINRPVVVFWHGGSWQRGSKEEVRFVGAALAGAGYLAILPDYRLYPEARFPQFIDDGALAVKWAREHARERGGDPEAIFVMGHSAGGHLAATLALDERYLSKVGGGVSWIQGWIGLSAPYELRWHLPRSLSILGAHAAVAWRPIALVSDRGPPALLVHGLEDEVVHPQEAVDIHERLREFGVPVECRIYADVGHAGTVMTMSLPVQPKSGTLAHIQDFIEDVVAGTPRPEGDGACPSLEARKAWRWMNPPPQPFLSEIPYFLPRTASR